MILISCGKLGDVVFLSNDDTIAIKQYCELKGLDPLGAELNDGIWSWKSVLQFDVVVIEGHYEIN